MIACRPTTLDELERVDALVVSSINDLTERHGFGAIASQSPPRFQGFSLADDARGLWTAVEDGEPVGFAWSWACEDFWFLAQLFVKPGVQANGLGQELLKRTLAHADKVGARQRALITFAFNAVSQGLYIRHGFLPRFPIYMLKISRERLPARPGPALEAVPLEGSDAEMLALAEVDRAAIGVARAKHHRLLLGEPGIRAFALRDGQRFAGYAYVSAGGHIGPLAVASADLVRQAFATTLDVAATNSTEHVSCFLPGSNAVLLREAIDAGMRITLPMLMMSTEELGAWSCYLPRNPGFM